MDGQAWETRPGEGDGQVPLLAIAGRLGCVTTRAESPELAVRLLLWLSQDQGIGKEQLSSRRPDTTLFRQSQEKSAGNRVEEAASRPQPPSTPFCRSNTESAAMVLDLRIPGRSEYLAALDCGRCGRVRAENPRNRFAGRQPNGTASPSDWAWLLGSERLSASPGLE